MFDDQVKIFSIPCAIPSKMASKFMAYMSSSSLFSQKNGCSANDPLFICCRHSQYKLFNGVRHALLPHFLLMKSVGILMAFSKIGTSSNTRTAKSSRCHCGKMNTPSVPLFRSRFASGQSDGSPESRYTPSTLDKSNKIACRCPRFAMVVAELKFFGVKMNPIPCSKINFCFSGSPIFIM